MDRHGLLLLLPGAIALAILSLVKGYRVFANFRRRALGSKTYRLVTIGLVAVVLIPVILYAGDYVRLRFHMSGSDPNAAFGSVTYFVAPQLKSGRYEIDFSQPQIQKCVHSLFPHLGYAACWTLKKNGPDIRPLSLLRLPLPTSHQSGSYPADT